MKRRGSRGFTLIEMIAVIAVILLVLALSIPTFRSARARNRRSGAVNAVRAALASGRQSAVMKRTVVTIEFISDPTSPNRGDRMYRVDKSVDIADLADRRLGKAIELPDFIKFDTMWANSWTLENGWDGDAYDYYDNVSLMEGTTFPYPDIAYRADGTAADVEGTTDIVLLDTVDNLRIVLRVLPATGLVVEAWHLQNPLQPEGTTNLRRKGWL